MKNIRVLIADESPANLLFLSNSLSDDFCMVGTVSDEKALIAAAVATRQRRPVLMRFVRLKP